MLMSIVPVRDVFTPLSDEMSLNSILGATKAVRVA